YFFYVQFGFVILFIYIQKSNIHIAFIFNAVFLGGFSVKVLMDFLVKCLCRYIAKKRIIEIHDLLEASVIGRQVFNCFFYVKRVFVVKQTNKLLGLAATPAVNGLLGIANQ